ncbi:uncharacterized protein LOC134812598 [Bolinopsis microptera]|uniref:uncharacterized protein LOC134812598 n=1 Tax=Bolinopsis microptera TaxID=2820187 RepID=UPI00307A00CE
MPKGFTAVNNDDGAKVGTPQPRTCMSSLHSLCNTMLTILVAVSVVVMLVRMDQRIQQSEIEIQLLRDENKIKREQIEYLEVMQRSRPGALQVVKHSDDTPIEAITDTPTEGGKDNQTEIVTENITEETVSYCNCSTPQPQSNDNNHKATPSDSDESTKSSEPSETTEPPTIPVSPTTSRSSEIPASLSKTYQKILFEVVDCHDISVNSESGASTWTCGEIYHDHNMIYRFITGVRVNKKKILTHVNCCNVTAKLDVP